MKKYMLAALVGGSLALPGAVFAQGSIGEPGGYSNYGQCQSALAQLRNEGRKDETPGSDGARYTNQEYNQKTRANFQCQKHGARYYIVQVDSQ